MHSHSFTDLLSVIIDNRGRTCPTAESGTPLIATNCISNSSLYPVFEKVRYVDDATLETWFRGHPEPGDLIFVLKGSPGRVALTPDPVNFCIAQDMVALRADEQKVDSRFLFALLRSSAVQERIADLHVGSLIPHFKKGDFDKLILDIPDLTTQKQIGDLYFALSTKIDLNRRMNETLEAMARAIFKSWFVDFDPVRAKAEGKQPFGIDADTAALFPDRLVDSEIGPIPEGWEVTKLEALVELNPRYRLRKGTDANYVEMKSVPTAGHRPTAWWLREFTSGSKFQNEDTLLARITPCLENGKTAFVDFLEEDEVGWGSTEFIVMRPKEPLSGFWGYCLARTEDFRSFAIQTMTGSSGRQRVQVDALANYKLTRPSGEIAGAFQAITGDLAVSIRANDLESHTLAELRDLLLPKLLSGEIRVKDAEKMVEDAV
jgi:type I restriction enzyme, S subunit